MSAGIFSMCLDSFVKKMQSPDSQSSLGTVRENKHTHGERAEKCMCVAEENDMTEWDDEDNGN